MPDYGAKVADDAIDKTARRIRSIYKRASEELQKKMADFTARHAAKQKEMFAQLEKGEITKAAYDSWMRGQVFIGKQWQSKVDQAAEIMHNATQEAAELVKKNRLNVFAENYNYNAFQLEKRTNGGVSFNLFNDRSVAELIKKKPKMLPEWKIDEKKDYKWNRQKVENAVTQGIIQGKKIDDITSDLCATLQTANESKMRTFARTSMTGAQNAGRQAQMEDAEEEGIKVKKRWLATLDSRTRDTHQELDGQTVPVDEPFEVDGMEIMYPGDPNAEPELVYNCRCTMIEIYEGIDRKSVRRAYDDDEETGERDTKNSYTVENMDYNEWKEWKETSKTEVHTQEEHETAEEIRQRNDRFTAEVERKNAEIDDLDREYGETYSKSLFAYGTDEYEGLEARLEELSHKRQDAVAEIDRINGERATYLSGNGEEQITQAFGEIEGAHSPTDDARACNEITGDVATQKNCGSCSLAYDARRRGIDCRSVLSYGTNNQQLSEWWDGLEMTTSTMRSPLDAAEEIRTVAVGWGNGARGIVQIDHTATSGHYFMFEVIDGKCVFIDPQTGVVGADHHFETALPGTVRYSRTDDKRLTRNALFGLSGRGK